MKKKSFQIITKNNDFEENIIYLNMSYLFYMFGDYNINEFQQEIQMLIRNLY